MNLIQQAFQELFPTSELQYKTILKYNKKLGDFNANIKLNYGILQVNMNYKWQGIDDEIQKGLIQTLLVKMFGKRFRYKSKTTFNIELYNNFVKKIPTITPITKTNPVLEASFHRVNQNHFYNLIDQPNLVWGTASKAKLACYNFHNDTITVSTIFQEARSDILDYLIYHELLHKKQKFKYKAGRNYFHTKKFRTAESLFPNQKQIEIEITGLIRKSKRPRKQSFFKSVFRNL